jgi:hypothetical protein
MKITIDVEEIARLAMKFQDTTYAYDTPFMNAFRELLPEAWPAIDKIMTEQMRHKYRWQNAGNGTHYIDHTQSNKA